MKTAPPFVPPTHFQIGFLTEQWHIRSSGMFAGSCIGVLLLVVCLEALRRASSEYDAYILRAHMKNTNSAPTAASRLQDASDDSTKDPSTQSTTPLLQPQSFKPSLVQQLVRAFLHMAQFAVAYIIMLLAMYFNGYLIICIFIGAFIGAFIFDWRSVATS
jgi:copper transporter 1